MKPARSPLLVAALLASVTSTYGQQEAVLRRIHEGLTEYRQLMGSPPGDVDQLVLLTSLEEADLYVPGGAGAELLRTRPTWATPDVRFHLDDWDDPFAEGPPRIASCPDFDARVDWWLHTDGSVSRDELRLDRYFPFTKSVGGRGRTEVTDAELARPSARLGLVLAEHGTQDPRRAAVLVEAIVPGYARGVPGSPEDLRPGDRLLAVGGHLVESLERLDDFVRGSRKERFELLVDRTGGVQADRLRSLATVWEDQPPTDARRVAERARRVLDARGTGALGVSMEDANPGARLTFLVAGGAAERAGLEVGDVLLAIDERPLMTGDELPRRITSLPAGQTVRLRVRGAGGERNIDVVLDRAPDWSGGYQRFAIHYGQLDYWKALGEADHTIPSQVVDLIEACYSRGYAVEWLEKELERPERSHVRAELRLLLAECLAISWKPERAEEVLEIARGEARLPRRADFALVEGLIHLREGRFDEAVSAFEEARGGERDPIRIAREQVALQGDEDAAAFERALERSRSKDPEVDAIVERARALYEGNGVAQDLVAAADLYRQAAQAGHPHAAAMLGYQLEFGQGVEIDLSESTRWYRVAAEQDHVIGMHNYGFALREGRGTEQDFAEAAEWFRRSADRGYAPAMVKLGRLHADGRGVREDPGLAFSYFREAAEKGDARGQNQVGWAYQRGQGVAEDHTEAVVWYRKAAEQGLANAQNNMGWMMRHGLGTERDPAEAVRWFQMAAEQGNAYGSYNLAEMYEAGEGVARDEAVALEHYRRAARDGHPRAGEILTSRGIDW